MMRRRWFLYGSMALALATAVACTNPAPNSTNAPTPNNSPQSGADPAKTLRVGAIPDEDPEKLQRRYDKLTEYLSKELEVDVVYQPVTDYTAAVTAFQVGDLDLVWFGGLTGVQARLQVPGADAIAQRDLDARFRSVFIANADSGIPTLNAQRELTKLEGKTFTFGSESSTSGRLMPQFFMEEAGLNLDSFKGEVGFSGAHDKTLKLVQAGTYEAGAMNEQIWSQRLQEGVVNPDKVKVIWRSPTYYDYHWVLHPSVTDRFGEDFAQKVQQAFLKLDPSKPEHREILDLFGAEKFIATKNDNYAKIEAVGRKIGKIQ